MTNQEAIEELESLIVPDDQAELQEAQRMAIKALEQEPCEDAVSRASLLNEIAEKASDIADGAECYDTIYSIIDGLPSVQPQAVDWDGMIGENNKQSLGKWYVGRIDGKSEDVIPTEKVIEIINKYRNGGQDG